MRYEHLSFGRRVIIQLTRTCPLSCAHCIVSSGPQIKESLDRELALKLIEQLGRDCSPHEVVFTGGEPFVKLDLLRELCAAATQWSMPTDAVTSCTWASSPGRAKKILASLPGLDRVSLSADRHHAEFLPLACVRNAATAAIDLGIETGLFITLDDEADNYVDVVRDFLGETLFSRLDLMTQIMHYSGRAAHLHGKLARLVSSEKLPDQSCKLPAAPIVLSDGRVMACCGDTVSSPDEWKNLQYGSLSEHSIDELIARNSNNPVVQLLRLGGPKAVLSAAQEAGYCCEKILSKQFDRSNICDVCKAVTEEDELIHTVKQSMNTLPNTLALKMQRLSEFGEWAN